MSTEPTTDPGPRGVDLEIWEAWPAGKGHDDLGVLYPHGSSKSTASTRSHPDNKSLVVLSNVSHKEALTATLHVFVRSLTIHGTEVEGLPEPPPPPGPGELPRLMVSTDADATPKQDEPGVLHLGGDLDAVEQWLRSGQRLVEHCRNERAAKTP